MKHILISITVSLGIYLVTSFVVFELRNPFAWVQQVPHWNGAQRFCLLIAVPLYLFAGYSLSKAMELRKGLLIKPVTDNSTNQ